MSDAGGGRASPGTAPAAERSAERSAESSGESSAKPTAVPTEAEILASLAEVAREHLGWSGDLAPSSRLVETLALDSLRLLTLVVEVENRFRIRLAEGEETGLETAGELARLVRRKLAADAATPASSPAGGD